MHVLKGEQHFGWEMSGVTMFGGLVGREHVWSRLCVCWIFIILIGLKGNGGGGLCVVVCSGGSTS